MPKTTNRLLVLALLSFGTACGAAGDSLKTAAPPEEIPEEWALRSIRGENGELLDKDTGVVIAQIDEDTGEVVAKPGVDDPTTETNEATSNTTIPKTLALKKTTTTTTKKSATLKKSTTQRPSTTIKNSTTKKPTTTKSVTSQPATTQPQTNATTAMVATSTTLPAMVPLAPPYQEFTTKVHMEASDSLNQLPSNAVCASRVKSVGENVPENYPYNQTKGGSLANTYLSTVDNGSWYQNRVDGDFTGTTDEVLQWGACKWGLKLHWVRSVAYAESQWWQGKNSGGVGLMGINKSHYGITSSSINNSTAMNVDFALAVIRACYEGHEKTQSWAGMSNWNGGGGSGGEEWNCYGRWMTGDYWNRGDTQGWGSDFSYTQWTFLEHVQSERPFGP